MVYRIPDSVNHTPNPLKKSYWAAISSVVLLIFATFQPVCGKEQKKEHDPAKGFKPAQGDFTSIYLQLAGSLEHHGSPEPYLRHIVAEHKRIDAKYAKVTGDNKTSSRPDYFTDEQLETLLKNWKQLEKPLQLDRMCRECGVYMRHAIMGSWHKTPDELVADEKKLTNQQKARYRNLLRKKYFSRNDLPEVDKFYADGGGWDQLSEDGKEQIGLRTELGMAKPGQREKYWKNRKGGTFIIAMLNEFQDKYVADKTGEVNSKDLKSMLIRRLKLNEENVDHGKFNWHQKDAIKYSHLIKFNFDTRFEFTKKKLPAEDAAMVRRVLLSMMGNLRIIAHSEMRAFRREKWIDKQVRDK